ncbi:MAG TPA: CAP domain-containing protein [Actinomycetota bacterium]|nr:CAP domain-containing protein [Actinomycetota bacterium]
MASPRRLTRIALVAALMTALTALVPSTATAASTPRTRMYRVTNNTRTNHAVRLVNLHDRLSWLARKHSIAMAQKGSLYHVANPSAYYLKGISWSTWGENVGVTGGTVWDVQRAFMQSAPHRANILNNRFRRVAVGTYRDGRGLLWVTIFFYG